MEALVQQQAESTAAGIEQATQARDAAVQDAETRAEEAKTKAQELEERLQRAEEALEKASSKEEGPSNQDIYDQGFQAAVRDCEAKAETVITERVNAAVANRNVEMLGQFNIEVGNAVARAKEPLEAQLNSANERATTAEARVGELQSSLETVQQKAADEWQRASDAHKAATDKYARAEKAEDEVRKYKEGKASQDVRIRGYLDDISRLKKLIPANAALSLAEIESVTRDRQRSQALIEEITVRAYDWETKQVLKKLLDANEKIIELECMLKDPRTQSNQIDFLKVLMNAEVDADKYMNLNLPMRQVIVKQCRAVNVRLNDLKTLIKKSQRPRKEALLFELYKVRGDEDAFYDQDDPEPEPSSDEDEDDNASHSRGRSPTPRQLALPTSRRARPATVSQVLQTPLPADPRVQNDLKRKGFPNDDEPEASSEPKDAPLLPPNAADDSTQRTGEASSAQQQSFDPANLDPQLAAIAPTPVQHHASPNPFASTATTFATTATACATTANTYAAAATAISSTAKTNASSATPFGSTATPFAPTATPSHPEQAPQPIPTRTPSLRQRPHLTASERQQRLRYVPNPESAPTSAGEAAAPTSIPGPTNFSFNMPKNIASGIRPHVRKYTQLSGTTNTCAAVENPPPATPNRDPIFKGLALLGPALANKKGMPDKKAALPGLPPPEEDEVLVFESSAVAEDPIPHREIEDRHESHIASDNEDEDGKPPATSSPTNPH